MSVLVGVTVTLMFSSIVLTDYLLWRIEQLTKERDHYKAIVDQRRAGDGEGDE